MTQASISSCETVGILARSLLVCAVCQQDPADYMIVGPDEQPVLVSWRPLMPLVPLRILLDHAAEYGYGLAAFNVNDMEQIQAIMEAAKETDSPVIVQASRGARSYSQDNYLRHLMLAAA